MIKQIECKDGEILTRKVEVTTSMVDGRVVTRISTSLTSDKKIYREDKLMIIGK